jgi:FkbM family methyltransferase
MPKLQHALRDVQPHTILGHTFMVEDLATSDLRRIVVGELNRDVYELKSLGEPRYVLDVGANIGLFALTVKSRWPRCHLRCFEPHPTNFASLAANLARNDVAATRVNKAVTAHGRSLKMVIGADNTGGASGWTSAAQRGVDTVVCPGATLHNALDGKFHDVVKIDIEGGEHELLEEFAHWSLVGALLIELHDNPTLRAAGYTMDGTEELIRNRMGPKPVVITRCEMGA